MPRFPALPPLSLYVHLPWCVRKCPYCDFNSHAARDGIPEREYVDALLRDLDFELPAIDTRRIETIFFGGGTPSLFSPEAIARLLDGIRARVAVAPDAETTLEANPGTVDTARFRGFREAGINRLSIGIQSFEDTKLVALGRIHGRIEALRAAEAARAAGFGNFNPDLMFGLPGQTAAEAIADLEQALAFDPPHLSVYQLTIEPNTAFHARPPRLPDDDAIAAMHEALEERLTAAGFEHYEVSAWARPGHRCRHNLNYWQFGDYLGLGAGAHGKLTDASHITRRARRRHPQEFMARAGTRDAVASEQRLGDEDAAFEFMLNALRLAEGFTPPLFETRTGLSLAAIEPRLRVAQARGLIERDDRGIRASARGARLLNDLLMLFLPQPRAAAMPSARG
jgi:oxygen-independent coproporphyrinogen-3 oxidase